MMKMDIGEKNLIGGDWALRFGQVENKSESSNRSIFMEMIHHYTMP